MDHTKDIDEITDRLVDLAKFLAPHQFEDEMPSREVMDPIWAIREHLISLLDRPTLPEFRDSRSTSCCVVIPFRKG
jgi:hypothetical protein